MGNFALIAFVSLFCLNSRGLGGPVTERTAMLIGDYLYELKFRCTNSFLAPEITQAAESCSIKPPPPDKPDSANEKQLLCAMYFEINSILCNSSFQEADFARKYGQDILVKDLCTDSMRWTVTSIPWYPLYQTSLEGLFKDTISCSSLCHDANRLHYANNVCKLYKVGYELMHETKPITVTAGQNNDETHKKLDLSDSKESEQPIVVHRDTVPTEILSRKSVEDVYLAHSSVPNPSAMVKPQNEIKIDTAITKNNDQPQHSTQAKNEQEPVSDTAKIEQQEVLNKVGKVRAKITHMKEHNDKALPTVTTKKQEQNQQQSKPPQQAEPVNDGHIKEHEVPQGGKESAENGNKGNNAIIDGLDPQTGLERDGVIQEPIFDRDGAGSEDLDDMERDDPPVIDDDHGDTRFSKLKKMGKETNSAQGSVETPDSMQKVIFPNQPEFPSDDEDHFFSFFLTVIVLVALLYVLYHNKSKVTKVVMGLIVEGRQPGRRRNSRGHAYKRLDTLEQAMSTNTTAPPSKIIY